MLPCYGTNDLNRLSSSRDGALKKRCDMVGGNCWQHVGQASHLVDNVGPRCELTHSNWMMRGDSVGSDGLLANRFGVLERLGESVELSNQGSLNVWLEMGVKLPVGSTMGFNLGVPCHWRPVGGVFRIRPNLSLLKGQVQSTFKDLLHQEFVGLETD